MHDSLWKCATILLKLSQAKGGIRGMRDRRLHFLRVRPAPARNTWYQLGLVENENIASHIHDKYY